MNNTIKIIGIGALCFIIGVVVGYWLVNNSADSFGGVGITRFPNSGIAARGAYFGTSIPTSITDGTLTVSGETRLNMPRQTGSVLTIASSSVDTLTAAQVCDNSVIAKNSWDGIASSTAITNLPTAATLYADCLTTNGDTYSVIFRNLHTTAGSSTLIVAGASTTLVGVDSNADVINGANEARITFTRYSATELIADIRELTAAD